MKPFYIILIIVAVVFIAAYIYAKKVIGKITFATPRFVGADLKSAFSGNNFTTIDLSENIDNQNSFSIPVNRLYAEVYYQGQLVGKSTTQHDPFVIPVNGNINVTQNITLAIAPGLDVVTQLISGQPIQFTYMIRAVLFNFFPFTYRGSFTY